MEITETSIITDPERALSILNRINQQGIKLSIDDFGTGYSSLAYLKKLPVSELKIDKSFVTDMNENLSDHTIVNATIQLGHNLGLKVVAEGVESQDIFNQLKAMGCDYQQGYFISRPLPPDELMAAFQDKQSQNIVSRQPEKFSERVLVNCCAIK
jgi:EAL domain-containing protein (putative c-di-GMP-specific phosphodiesterase class I)